MRPLQIFVWKILLLCGVVLVAAVDHQQQQQGQPENEQMNTRGISREERGNLCDNTKATCGKACPGAKAACDKNSLQWNCGCPLSSSELATFPIPNALCHVDLSLCESSCKNLGSHDNRARVCRLQCMSSYPCGTSKAPVYNGTDILPSTTDDPHTPKQIDAHSSSSSFSSSSSSVPSSSASSSGSKVVTSSVLLWASPIFVIVVVAVGLVDMGGLEVKKI